MAATSSSACSADKPRLGAVAISRPVTSVARTRSATLSAASARRLRTASGRRTTATGRPCRVMTISSPVPTRSRISGRAARASLAVMVAIAGIVRRRAVTYNQIARQSRSRTAPRTAAQPRNHLLLGVHHMVEVLPGGLHRRLEEDRQRTFPRIDQPVLGDAQLRVQPPLRPAVPGHRRRRHDLDGHQDVAWDVVRRAHSVPDDEYVRNEKAFAIAAGRHADARRMRQHAQGGLPPTNHLCLLYTSDAADE